MQAALDTALARASTEEQARFAMLIGTNPESALLGKQPRPGEPSARKSADLLCAAAEEAVCAGQHRRSGFPLTGASDVS
jgi:hypothetical protein